MIGWAKRAGTVVLAGVLLTLALRGVDWKAFTVTMSGVDLRWVAVCLSIQFLALACRSFRWTLLLSAQAGPCFLTAFAGEAVGYLGNTFLPARAGEALRTVIVARRSGCAMAFVLGTAATERISDAVFAACLAFAMTLILPEVPAWVTGSAASLAAGGVGVILVLSHLPRVESVLSPILRRIPRIDVVLDKASHLAQGLSLGVRALFGHWPGLALFAGLTVAIWCLDTGVVVLSVHALGLSLTFPQAALFLTALGLSSAVPSTPGYVGMFQFVAVSVLVPFGFAPPQAIAAIILLQALGVIHVLVWGGVGWWVFSGSPRVAPKGPAVEKVG